MGETKAKKLTHFRVGQIANAIGVSNRTVANMCDEGLLDSHRLPYGKLERRISSEAIFKMVDARPDLEFLLGRLGLKRESE